MTFYKQTPSFEEIQRLILHEIEIENRKKNQMRLMSSSTYQEANAFNKTKHVIADYLSTDRRMIVNWGIDGIDQADRSGEN